MNAVAVITPAPKYLAKSQTMIGTLSLVTLYERIGNRAPKADVARMTKIAPARSPREPSNGVVKLQLSSVDELYVVEELSDISGGLLVV